MTKPIAETRPRVRETQPIHFIETPEFVTLFGDDLEPNSEQYIKRLLAGCHMKHARVLLNQLNIVDALNCVVGHMATARQLMIFMHSKNWTPETHGVDEPGLWLAFSETHDELLSAKALLNHLSTQHVLSLAPDAPKPLIHFVGCEAGVLRSQINRDHPLWQSSYLLLYSGKKSTTVDNMASSLSATVRYVDLCAQENREVDPFKLFYISGIHRSECMTLMGGDLQEPLVWHAPKSMSAMNDLSSLASLQGSAEDIEYFHSRVKLIKDAERRIIPEASFRELLSSRIRHGDEEAVENIVRLKPDLLATPSVTGSLPLGEAVETNNMAVVESLLEGGADPDLADNDGRTAMMIAIDYEIKEAIPLLLKHGARPDVLVDDDAEQASDPEG